MIRTFCDCCGDEITGANTPASGGKDLGRLTATVKTKPGGSAPFMQIEVMTACGSTWNGGHFCKYCVIDAINKLDDRPQPDNVPRYQLQQSETRYMNLLLDLQRVMDDQPTICNIPEVEQLRARIGGVLEVVSAAPPSVAPSITDDMALAFHRATTDGDIGQEDVDTIKAGLRAVFAACGVAVDRHQTK